MVRIPVHPQEPLDHCRGGAATCTLKILQLWHPPFLEYLRGYFIGRTLLGTTFAWSDFPHYLLGCGIAWLWMEQLGGKGNCGPPSPN